MDKTKASQSNQVEPGKDLLKEALEKAASIDEIHKGPSGKIPMENDDQAEPATGNAESADDSGE